MEKGLEQGRSEGEHAKALDTASRMKADGMPAEVIAKYTGLTVEQISRINV